MIEVKHTGDGDPMRFEVAITDGTATCHEVTVSARDFGRLAQGRTPDRMIQAVFRFLLDREPKESILRGFDVSVIGRYFPEFEQKLREYL